MRLETTNQMDLPTMRHFVDLFYWLISKPNNNITHSHSISLVFIPRIAQSFDRGIDVFDAFQLDHPNLTRQIV